MVITDEDIAYLSDLAPAFDPDKAYVVPDMIIADGILKMCVVEGIGNAATFVDASLQDVIKAVIAQSQTPESLVAKLADLAPEYRIGDEYEVDDLVIKEGKLQMCVQAEEGEPPLFQPTTVEAAIAKLRDNIADVREIAEDAASDAQEAKEKSEEALGAAGDAVAVADSASNRVGLVEALIPNEATPDNQLADKDFVNSSIATNTATFIRTFNLISDLHLPLSDKDNYEVVGAAIADYISQYMPRVNPDINDYCFVQIPRAETELVTYVRIDRYKYTLDQPDDSSSSPGDDDMGSDPEVGEDPGYAWKFEFSLNNSSFTAEQWAAINSGITSAAVTKLNGLPDATTLANVLDSKVSTSTTVNGISLSTNITLYGTDIIKDPETSGPSVKTAIDNAQFKANDAYDLANGKYTKPGTGIPESDLSSDLKTKIAGKTDRSQVCSEWHSQTAYTTTSVVLRDGKFYLCKTAHTSGSVWDGTKWEETTLDKVMERYGKLTPIYADGGWTCSPSSVTHGYYGEIEDLRVVHTNEWWNLQGTRVNGGQTVTITGVSYDSGAVELTFSDGSINVSAGRLNALHLVGYTLGSQSDKPLLAKDAYPISIGNGTKTVAYNATNYIDIGRDTKILGSNTMAFGHSSTAGGDNAMAIGPNANVQTDNAMALGSNTTASGTQALAIGNGANASAYGQAEGLGATAVTDGTAIGFQAHAYGPGVAIGAHAEINGGEAIAVGHNAFATASNAGQIGPGTNNTADTLKFRDAVVVGPNGDVAPLKRHKLDLAVYELGNASVTFPDGFKAEGAETTYRAPSGGETIEFFGPILGTGNFDYWVPEAYKDYEYFDLEEVSDAWFLFDSAQETDTPTPNIMAFGYYSPGYSIAGWGSLSPVLTIADGSESGGHPSMVRPIVPTGDTIAALGDIPRPSTVIPKMDSGNGSAGGASQYPGQYAKADHVHPSDTSKLDAKEGILHEIYSDDWTVLGQLPQGMTYASGPTWRGSHWVLELWSGSAPALVAADGQPTQTAVSLTFYNGSVTAVRDSASGHEMKGYRLGGAYGTNADKLLLSASGKHLLLANKRDMSDLRYGVNANTKWVVSTTSEPVNATYTWVEARQRWEHPQTQSLYIVAENDGYALYEPTTGAVTWKGLGPVNISRRGGWTGTVVASDTDSLVATSDGGNVSIRGILLNGNPDQNTSTQGAGSHSEGNGSKCYAAYSHCEGYGTRTAATANGAHSEGNGSKAGGEYSHVDGCRAVSGEGVNGTFITNPHKYAWVWSGVDDGNTNSFYFSNGNGTFNINPQPASGSSDPATGFFIGGKSLRTIINEAIAAALQGG